MATRHFCDICEAEIEFEYMAIDSTVQLEGQKVTVFALIKDRTACKGCTREAVLKVPVPRKQEKTK